MQEICKLINKNVLVFAGRFKSKCETTGHHYLFNFARTLAMKFVSPLNEATSKELRRIVHDDHSAVRRERAQAVLLSDKGFTLTDLSCIFDRERDTVSSWLTRWEERAYDGLSDEPRVGRPPKTSVKEDQQILRTVKKTPHNLRQARAVLQKKKY